VKRIKYIIIAAICFLLYLASTNKYLQSENYHRPRIACVGDSITYGLSISNRSSNSYPEQLAEMLGNQVSVRNLGVSGTTLLEKGDKPYLKTLEFNLAHEFKPNIVVILLGTNDTKPINWKYKSNYIKDYIALINSFKRIDSNPNIWICYPVPVYSKPGSTTDKIIRNEIIPMINIIASQTNVRIIDLYKPLSNKQHLFPDFVHPNAEGAKIIANEVFNAITYNKK
jgi:acyl-CoA thioesterase-1